MSNSVNKPPAGVSKALQTAFMSDEDLAELGPDGEDINTLPARYGDGSSFPDLKALKPSHMKIIEYHLRGYTQAEICRMLQVCATTVWRTLKDPLAQPYITGFKEQADLEFSQLRMAANDAVRRGLNSKDERTALIAAKTVYEKEGDMRAKEDKNMTAEDVIAAVLARIEVNVTVNN